MADKTPIRATFSGSVVIGLQEYEVGDSVGISFGGTGATTAAGARVSLGLEIGVDVQPFGNMGSIIDADGDTKIDLETTADDDTVRFSVGDTPVGYGTVTDIFVMSSASWTVNMGVASVATTSGAPISITAGHGGATSVGGDVIIVGGDGGVTSGGGGDIILAGGAHVSGGVGAVVLSPADIAAGETTELRFNELAANGSNYVGFKAADSIASNIIWTLPIVDSTGTQALVSDGAGVLSFATIASGVTIKDEGTTVTGGPHGTLNFIGAGVTAIDAGGGQVDITISSSSGTIKDEGVVVPGGPHDTLNFIGAGVTATNAGGGQVDVTIPSSSATLAAVQARRTTARAITTAFGDFVFDTTDEETNPAVLEHNNITLSVIDVKEAGTYLIRYEIDLDTSSVTTNAAAFIDTRVRANSTTTLPGSEAMSVIMYDNSVTGSDMPMHLSNAFVATLSANDALTLQIQKTEQGVTESWVTGPGMTFQVIKLEGVQGPAGTGSSTLRMGHTYAISGEVKVAVSDTDFINPFFVSLATGQTIKLVKVRHKINSGTSATCKLQKNGVDITGFTGISVTTTATDTDPTDVTLADNDQIALVVTAVSGTPTNLSFTVFLELTG